MASLNKVQIIGNLGKDPEVRKMDNGKSIVNLTVATTERWKDKSTGESKEKTEWHRVVVFNENLANLAEKYLKKGSSVYLEGQLQTRKWVNKEGVDQYSTEIVLQNYGGSIVLLGGKAEEGSGRSTTTTRSAPKSAPSKSIQEDLNDDMPF